jgi:hypothetical protein
VPAWHFLGLSSPCWLTCWAGKSDQPGTQPHTNLAIRRHLRSLLKSNVVCPVGIVRKRNQSNAM